jgi:integrase
MAIRKFYSKREKKHWKYDAKLKMHWSWGFDIWLDDGRRRREAGFMTESDAVVAVGRIRSDEKERKYGFTPEAEKPRLGELVRKRLADTREGKPKSSATRILTVLLEVVGTDQKVEELTTPHLKKFVEKRAADGLSPSSINRELNEISAMLNNVAMYYPRLTQWRPPRMPRPKQSKRRRERIYTDDEREKLLKHLLAPQQPGEWRQEAQARRRVGLKLMFALSVGLRHGEMNRIKKTDINFEARSLKIVGTKTEFVSNPTRYIQPLTDTELAILREFCDESETEFVFTRSGNEAKFYKVLRKACEACSIPYGRKVENGLVFHDTRHTVTTRMLEARVSAATVQEQMGWSDRTFVLYYSHATPESRDHAAEVREQLAHKGVKKKQELTPELIEALSARVAGGELSPLTLAAILRGEEAVPEDMLASAIRA